MIKFKKLWLTAAIFLAGSATLANNKVAAADTLEPAINQQARQIAGKDNGFASGTTGGFQADTKHTFVVRNREQLVKALKKNKNGEDLLIVVDGKINMNADSQGRELTADDYADPDYNLPDYLKAYDPQNWGYDKVPSGKLEEARYRSQKNQNKQITVNIPSNTTIFGINNAAIDGGNLNLKNSTNIIIRNISFETPYDFFPQWDPTDDEFGNWNSEYDSITIKGAQKVWLDHNYFTDGKHPDSESEKYFGRKYQHHDGVMDIVNGADYITISNSKITNHDKTMLIGNSDSKTSDRGKLHVTLNDNIFEDIVQRQPRVRFGQVHLFNNYFTNTNQSGYQAKYIIGAGFESQVLAENNAINIAKMKQKNIIKNFKATNLTMKQTLFNDHLLLDNGIEQGFNPVTWQPPYNYVLKDTQTIEASTTSNAGPIL
ncbi:pectate lyase family protein [Bombilactobacillus thymidiniphilus]|uniref:Pectate lyase n=1 Tax=Bombilactobacillus thymidiniphilus TaxID=2923363 RepID=A0ABY4PEQ5_9LACO|nr:pectate lyase [Bombilactobacillus thymidiniphilus]UQS84045.1 pectate lyase [Bombilactobacillus thymidiniphilus]